MDISKVREVDKIFYGTRPVGLPGLCGDVELGRVAIERSRQVGGFVSIEARIDPQASCKFDARHSGDTDSLPVFFTEVIQRHLFVVTAIIEAPAMIRAAQKAICMHRTCRQAGRAVRTSID